MRKSSRPAGRGATSPGKGAKGKNRLITVTGSRAGRSSETRKVPSGRAKAAAKDSPARDQQRRQPANSVSLKPESGRGLGPVAPRSRPAPVAQRRPAPVAAPTPALPPEPVAVRIETVDPERAGQRIDNFLSSRLKGVPKSTVYRVLRTGQVRINGKRAKPEQRLEAGDLVRIPPLRVAEPGELVAPSEGLRDTLAERIVFEDAEFLVLDKPCGLAAHGGSGISLGAIEAMRAIRPTQDIELVHRLDRDTSGLLLLAKKHSALRRLQALIRENKVQKRYFALIAGSPKQERFEVNAALHKNQLRGGERMVEVNEDLGKASLSRFKVIERYADATLVEVEIVTGRTHQIRVHAQHIGHPLAGDPKYGDEDFNKLMKARGLKRLFLHAHSLRFPWGESGDARQFNAPMGPDLRAVLDKLGR